VNPTTYRIYTANLGGDTVSVISDAPPAPPVGGIAEAPDVDASPLGTAGSSSAPYLAIAGVAAAVVLAAGALYARRRRRGY
jgi:LPXTG-motif cell wall-anchored protein